MDHLVLLERIEHRLDSTDDKIKEVKDAVTSIDKKLQLYTVKTAVLETQMNGVIRLSIVISTAIVGVIATLFMKLF